MNIFYSDPCPVKCAINLDSKRVVKMTLETCQILMTSLNCYGVSTPYKATHKNHPCCIWARETRANFEWLLKHFIALLSEYQYRYGKKHKCFGYVNFLYSNINVIPTGNLTDHKNCTKFKEVDDIILAYRMALKDKWINDKRKPVFHKRNQPSWYNKI
ncbi:MAG: pyrimidine dimer DNA glycosylase/endonuclease V [Candidatus Kapaibacterium sp.]|jgi:hypothetical protein